jgi:hypothetical protein
MGSDTCCRRFSGPGSFGSAVPAEYLLVSLSYSPKVKNSLIMRLSCGNTLKSIRGAAPFGCGAHQAFP